MKKQNLFAIFLLFSISLPACSGTQDTSTGSETASISEVYTAVGMTLAASNGTPTTLPSLVTTPTTFSAPTPYVSPTIYASSTTAYTFSSAVGCDNSVYVSDVTIPDGTTLAPGEIFTKTWGFQNTGTCAWANDYSITFLSGSDMDGETTSIEQYVSSGGTAQISVSLTAPSADGTYTGYWQLANKGGTKFGQSVYVQIVVSDDASTSTATPTTASEVEYTSTPTATSAPTEIPTETSVPAETVEP